MCTRILDNLKDYAAQALVNTIDHLGTVAYKLNDILEQQTEEISSIDLRVVCLNQVICTLLTWCEFIRQISIVETDPFYFFALCVWKKLLTCQTYTDNEGLRQQQLLAIIPRHHKHYTLPSKRRLCLFRDSTCLIEFKPLLITKCPFVNMSLDPVNKKVHFSRHTQSDSKLRIQVRGHLYPSGARASTLNVVNCIEH